MGTISRPPNSQKASFAGDLSRDSLKNRFGIMFHGFSLVRASAEPVKTLVLPSVFNDFQGSALLRANRHTRVIEHCKSIQIDLSGCPNRPQIYENHPSGPVLVASGGRGGVFERCWSDLVGRSSQSERQSRRLWPPWSVERAFRTRSGAQAARATVNPPTVIRRGMSNLPKS